MQQLMHRIGLFVMACTLLASAHLYGGVVKVNSEAASIALGTELKVFADPDKLFDAVTVLNPSFPLKPEVFKYQPPNLGYPKHRYWVRLRLTNESSVPLERLIVLWRGSSHQIHVYTKTEEQTIQDLGTGDDIRSRHGITRLKLPAHSSIDLAVQLDSASALAIDLRLMTETELARIDRRDYLWFGLFIGIVLAIAIYVFALFLALHDRLYLLFVSFAVGNVCYQLLSEGYLYAWMPLSFRPTGNALANLMGVLFIVCLMLFVRGYLRLWESAPKSDSYIIKPWILINSLAFPIYLFKPWLGNSLIALGTVSTAAMMPLISWRAMRAQRQVLSFHVAMIVFMTSGFVHVAKRMGLIGDAPMLSLVLQVSSAMVCVAFSIAVLERVRRIAEENRLAQQTYGARLEREVEERTRDLDTARRAAEAALADKRAVERQLIDAEKMASLGEMVAGVAHEINTPIGVAYTAGTFLADSTQRVKRAVENGSMKRSDLDEYIQAASESSSMISRNLERAAQLIRSFKQVSVDRTSDERRIFVVDQYLQQLIDSLRLTWKHRPITLDVQCPADISMDSFPGALGQVLTNLIQNSLLHAFAPDQAGRISIVVVVLPDQWLEIQFSDDGCGVTEEQLKRIFDPFYTTKRDQGGTGLGLHLVYNLANQKLGGRIKASSEPGKGLRLLITLPRSLEK